MLGGVVIACYREETKEFAHRLIDVKFFQEPAFDQKHYLNEVSQAVQDLVNELKVTKEEPITLCTGYVLSRAVFDLRQKGFDVSTGKITGNLQGLAEQAYLNEIKKLGYEPIPDREVSNRMRAKSFYDMLKWIKEKPERYKFAKTGWRFFTGKPKRQWGRYEY